MVRDDEAADVLRQVARHAFDFADQAHEIDEQAPSRRSPWQRDVPQLFRLIHRHGLDRASSWSSDRPVLATSRMALRRR